VGLLFSSSTRWATIRTAIARGRSLEKKVLGPYEIRTELCFGCIHEPNVSSSKLSRIADGKDMSYLWRHIEPAMKHVPAING
jgi:hypothetical protein